MTQNGQPGGETIQERVLAVIDPLTGVATARGRTEEGRVPAALAFAFVDDVPEPFLFTVTGQGGATFEPERKTLFKMNPDSAQASILCKVPNGRSSGQALAYNPEDGFLYHAAGDVENVFERVSNVTPVDGDSCEIEDVPIPELVGSGEVEALVYWEEEGVFLWKRAGEEADELFKVSPQGGVEPHTLLDFADAKGFAFGLVPGVAAPTVSCASDDNPDATELTIDAAQEYDAVYVYVDGALETVLSSGETSYSVSRAIGNACVQGVVSGIPSRKSCCRTEPRFVRGEANDDGAIDLTDGVFILNHLFLGGPAPKCRKSADSNDDGRVDLTDGIAVFNFLFLSSGPLPPPNETCGADPTADEISCETSPTDC